MITEETDILVIGAGPAGLITAREASRKGAMVTVWEEHTEIGRPCHCAGLLSLKGLESIGVTGHRSFVQNKVKGARFFSPSGLSFTVERDKVVACAVDRRSFDLFLGQQAIEAGAQIRLNSRVQAIEHINASVIVYGDKESTETKIVVDAEGVSSSVVKALGLKPLDQSGLLPGFQSDLKGVEVDPDYVEIHTGERIAPGFFAWVIPLSEDSARVGLACKEADTRERLERFVRDRFEDKSNPEWASIRSGRIVTCGPIEKTYNNSLLVVGDAAGQTKPTTGGGVILGGVCASIAGEVAAEAIRQEDFTIGFLQRYESRWKERLGKEFKTGLMARKIMNSLSDRAIDRIFKVVIDENLQGLLSAEGDIDFQSGVLLKMLSRKEILRILPSFLRALSPFG